MLQQLELRVMPLALTLFCILLMTGLAGALPGLSIRLPEHGLVAALAATAGIGLMLASVLHFRRASTTLDPRDPERSTALVSNGVYRFSRNPNYLGMALLLLACFEWLANLAALAPLLLFVLYLTRFQIIPEERALHARFGSRYEDYCRRVRRWL